MAKKTNFEMNGSKYYRVTRTIGHKADGTAIRKTFYGSGINEANEKANEYMKKIKNGLNANFDKIILSVSMKKWLYDIKQHNDIKTSTFNDYCSIFKNYIESSDIAFLAPCNIKSIKLQEYYNKLAKNGISSNVIRKITKLLNQYFKYLQFEGYVFILPTANVVIPTDSDKVKEEIVEFYNEYETKYIISCCENTKMELMIKLALSTGLRLGELLALKFSDINYETNQIKICRSIKRISENGKSILKIQEPKTKNSKRILDVPANVMKLFNHKTSDEFIFTEDSQIIEPRRFWRWWKEFTETNNIPYKKPHSLRHTYATLLLSKGVPISTVAKLLGHSSIQITQIYAQVIPELKTEAIQKINYLF